MSVYAATETRGKNLEGFWNTVIDCVGEVYEDAKVVQVLLRYNREVRKVGGKMAGLKKEMKMENVLLCD